MTGDAYIITDSKDLDFCRGEVFFAGKIENCPPAAAPILPTSYPIKGLLRSIQAYAVYEFLRNKTHKNVYFLHCEELAFYCLQSQRAGLEFRNIKIIIKNASTQTVNEFKEKSAPATRPLVSVCMTHKDRWDYLEDALISLKNQTYENIEVLIYDDNSTDTLKRKEMLNILPGSKWIQHEETCGPGYCRNRAAEMAQGEYLLFMDDDNCAKPHEVDSFLRAAIQTDADVITCSFDGFQVAERNGFECVQFGQRNIFLGDDLIQGQESNCFGDTNSFFKKKSFLDAGGFEEKKDAPNEDWNLLLKMCKMGHRIFTLPQALFYYRWHSEQRTKLFFGAGSSQFGEGLSEPFC